MLLALLFGCVTSEPSYIGTSELDRALATGDVGGLCAGLRMKDPETREAAASKLSKSNLDKTCICDRLSYEGRWDAPILSGLVGADDTAALACVGELLDDTAQTERPALATALLKIPAARTRVALAARADADPSVRAAAMPIFLPTKDPGEVSEVAGWLASAPDAGIRAAAAAALFGHADAADALRKAATTDTDPATRGAALASLRSLEPADLDALLCGALLRDAAPEVRLAALGAMRATRDPEQLACLKERALTEEPTAEVRAALLDTLGASADPAAAAVLCDAIPTWVRLYVKDAAPAEAEDILKVQNNRDFRRSYDCVQAAVRQAGGYTCAGRAYVAGFFRELGGRAPVPNCNGGGRAAPSNEITF